MPFRLFRRWLFGSRTPESYSHLQKLANWKSDEPKYRYTQPGKPEAKRQWKIVERRKA